MTDNNTTTNLPPQVYTEIDQELANAELKHPVYPGDLLYQLAIIQEEAGELTKAIVDFRFHNSPFAPIRAELIQTAAACVRMLKNLPS